MTDAAPVYELLVVRSYMDYVWLMLERACAECGLKDCGRLDDKT